MTRLLQRHVICVLFAYILAANYAVVSAFPSEYTTRGGSCDEADPRTPKNSRDSHLHVLNPIDYPIEEGSEYTPGVYTVWDNAVLESRLDLEHVVLIQPSIYGTNNTLLLESLRAYGPTRARGVLVFNIEEISMAELNQWHAWGVCGVRINFLSTGETPPADELKRTLSESLQHGQVARLGCAAIYCDGCYSVDRRFHSFSGSTDRLRSYWRP
ncbi:hypothetical protein V2G26_013347 [Clonostachys chloroleuca]